MAIWIIEPRDPVIFRDGRPFGSIPGAKASTLPFPFPSTIAGGVRTRAGSNSQGVFQKDKTEEVKNISVKGPFLVELNKDQDIHKWLFPTPLDALVLNLDPISTEKVKIKKLTPIELPSAALTDLTIKFANLSLIGMPSPDPNKPHNEAPRFWYWEQFSNWLMDAKDNDEVLLAELGHNGPLFESRTHVRIIPQTQTAQEGVLFQTRGLEFTRLIEPNNCNNPTSLLNLAMALETNTSLIDGITTLGGEQRMVFWQKSQQINPFAQCPENIRKQILEKGACRIVLLTPGYFKDICNPICLQNITPNVTNPTLKAVAVSKPQVISGWDFEHNRPKPTRRLATAGTVFFLKFEPKPDVQTIEKWIDSIWMNPISDDAQSCLDGFGLAVLGTWSGENEKLETT
ncbi:MAG: hypothetical protein FD167_348 [bacterium]|nr:MAG: hypothetical protein FD167_348 [bacterium]